MDKDDNFRHFVDDSYAELVVSDAEVLDRAAAALQGRAAAMAVRGRDDRDVVEFDGAIGAQADELDAVATHRDDMPSGSTARDRPASPGRLHLHHEIRVTCGS